MEQETKQLTNQVLQSELAQTKRHHESFRQHLLKLDLAEMVGTDKGHFFFGEKGEQKEGQQQSQLRGSTSEKDGEDGHLNEEGRRQQIDSSVVQEMRKYKNLLPDDVEVLRQLRVKITNYLLEKEQELGAGKAERQSSGAVGPLPKVQDPLDLEPCAVEFEIYSKTADPRSIANQLKKNEKLIDKCKEDFIKQTKAIEDLKKWMSKVCECYQEAKAQGAENMPSANEQSAAQSRKADVSATSRMFDRLKNISEAYQQWDKLQSSHYLTDSERSQFTKRFEEKKKKHTFDEINATRQKSIDELEDIQAALQKLNAIDAESELQSVPRQSTKASPSKGNLVTDIHETLGSLHSHLTSLKDKQLHEQAKRIEVDVGKLQEDILSQSVQQIDVRLRSHADSRRQEPLPPAKLDQNEYQIDESPLEIEQDSNPSVQQENEEHVRAYQELINRLQEQLAQYQEHQIAEKERERVIMEQIDQEKQARLLLSQENIEEMVSVAMDEEGAAARTRSQSAQVSRSWFQADAGTQVELTTGDKQVQVDLRAEAKAAQVETACGIVSVEVIDQMNMDGKRQFKSPIAKSDITNIFDEALQESQQKLKGLSPNARTLQSAVQMEILGSNLNKFAEQNWQRLEGKLEERTKVEKLQRELENVRQANVQLEAAKRSLDDQARQRSAALNAQQAHINKQKMTLIEKIKQQNSQKKQLAEQESRLEKLQQFLQQREQEQLLVEQAFDKEKGQLDEEWQELAKEWNIVEGEKEALKTGHSEMQRKEQKIERLRERLKAQRGRVVKKEKWCIRQETLCRALSGELGRFMRSMDQQNVLLRSLEYAVEQLFSKICQEGEDGEQVFEEERDTIMLNRYQLDELRKAMNGILRDQRTLHDLNKEQIVGQQIRGRALSQGGRRRGSSLDSRDSNLSYLHFRYDNSFDAAESKAFNELKEVLALANAGESQALGGREQKMHSFVSEAGNLPRYSRRSRCSQVRSPRGSAIRASALVALRPSLRPSIQIRQSMQASQALVRNSVARRSTIWPHSVKSQVDEVDESLPEEAGFDLKYDQGQGQGTADGNGLLLDMNMLNPYNMISPIQDLEEAAEDVDVIRKTNQSDQIMKEISFKTLTRPTQNFYNLNLVNESGSTESQGEEMDENDEEGEDEHIDFEYTRTVTEARRSGLRSGRPSTDDNPVQPPAQHQATQASDFPMPYLDLTAYAEYEKDERRKSNISVSIALQTGESIRQSARASNETQDQQAMDPENKPEPRTSKQSHGQESTLSFANHQSFLLPHQLMLKQAKPSETQRSARDDALRQSLESNERPRDSHMQVPDPNELVREGEGASLRMLKDPQRKQSQIFSYDSQGNERLSEEFRLSTEQPNEGEVGQSEAEEPDQPASRQSERADVSILNFTMDEFIQSQLADLEKIGISGDLFREVWAEYKRQGKSKQQMQSDLIQYQFMIEQKIQRDNKRRIKREKREKDGKYKDKKRDKKDKKEKKKGRREHPEDTLLAGDQVQGANMERSTLQAQREGADARRSKRQFNYDEDYQESSVFVEPFKLQERETIDPDRSLIYHDKSSGAKGGPDGMAEPQGAGERHKSGSSRFSVSFAHDEAQSDATQEVAVEEYADNAEFQQQIQALQVANADFYGGSLINQIQNNQNLFMLFKERASAKSISGRSTLSKRSSHSRVASSEGSGADDIGQHIAEGASPTEEGRTVAGLRTRTLKTIEEEAHEGTEHRDTSQHSEKAMTAGVFEDSKAQLQPGALPRQITAKPQQLVPRDKPLHHRPKGAMNSSSDLDISSQSNSRRSIKYFEQLKSLNAGRKSRPSATSAKSREGEQAAADGARGSVTAFAASISHSKLPRSSGLQHHHPEMRRSTINETMNKSANQSDLWENFRVTERDPMQAKQLEAQAFVFGGQVPTDDSAKKQV